MTLEDVRGNYNRVGIDIIEMMYSDGYLSVGGDQSVDTLADAAGVSRTSRILDIGCGLGGPALRLAERFGCHVTGLDLIDVNIESALQRAIDRDLAGLTEFQTGNATRLPFDDASFNLVWGLDAWCHVDDKRRLIGECARVLEPGGTCAFTDWLILGEMSGPRLPQVLEAAASPGMISAETYRELFSANGLALTDYTDISATLVDQYRGVMARLPDLEARLRVRFSPKVYSIIYRKNRLILEGFEQGDIGGGRFILRHVGR